MAAATFARRIGTAIKETAIGNRTSGGWYDPHMAAASRAVAERIPLVDFVLEVRDARVWTKYFEDHNCVSYGVNAHNKDNIREFLNFLQARVRELKKSGHSSHATTMMLVGIPNVGKSALANSLHQIGRISAAEKGKLKHAVVSPEPGETKNISSLKIASHPNIYVLDTPGILPPKILNIEVCSKLALTGAIRDILVGERVIVQYLLTILNSSDKYKKWASLSATNCDSSLECSTCSNSESQKRGYPSDHTQDFIVNDVRRILFETISSFDGKTEDEKDMGNFIEVQLLALHKALHVPMDSSNDASTKVASKLLNLYRTGRLGRYTLDSVPVNS
ncbi:DAR GTPase 2, mitochondrial isoform X2 [Momordica charantia]|uniref:DAR GTPase 2, mitochondrial isoform X2 n=1 Tax=Momordica charantia TaxID=3673 RepID=A0A6J1CZT5_MOMCH|nr:DAR GTPase 2, mitochondrial isoform X2 [Momordica charantia]